MPYQVQATGNQVIGIVGATSPNELYGPGVFGPAIYGPANMTGLSDAAASTYNSLDGARALMQLLTLLYPLDQYRIALVAGSILEAALGIASGE